MGFDLSQVDFDTLRKVDVRTAEPNSLVDIKEITIDQELPREQRMAEFVRQVLNPYCFKVGKIAVSVGFSQDGVTFEQRMEQYLQTL